ESKRTPRWARAWANSTIPVLSETEIRAVWIFMGEQRGLERKSGLQVVRKQFLAQRAACNSEHFGCLGLIAARLFECDLQDGALDTVHDHGQHVARFGFAQVRKIAFKLIAYGLFKDVGFAHFSGGLVIRTFLV